MEDEPSISLGPLKIWIEGRQFPDAVDYWDANWLSVTAVCEGNGSRVRIQGSFIHLGEIVQWRDSLVRFQTTMEGEVELPTVEPELAIKISGRNKKNGHLDCAIDMTGNHLAERHHFLFDLDQSYLGVLLSQLASVIREHPVRDENQKI